MNKCLKNILGFTAFTIGTMAVVNKAIDIICSKKYSSSENEDIYSWRYGDISYVKKVTGLRFFLFTAQIPAQTARSGIRYLHRFQKSTLYTASTF